MSAALKESAAHEAARKKSRMSSFQTPHRVRNAGPPGTLRQMRVSIADVASRFGTGSLVLLTSVLGAQDRQSLAVPELRSAELVSRVDPRYPAGAQTAAMRLSGAVILQVQINPAGAVESLKMAKGHALLVHAAFEAVKQWRYRPAMRDGRAVAGNASVWVTFFPGYVRILDGLEPTPAAGSVESGLKAALVNLSRFAGAWDGAEIDRTGNRPRGWKASTGWSIDVRDGRLVRTEGSGQTAHVVAYDLDRTEARYDGSDAQFLFADSPDPARYIVLRSITTLTSNRVELRERLSAPATMPNGSDAYVEVDELWQLSGDSTRLEAIRNSRTLSRGSAYSYTIKYAFQRKAETPKR